jgi:chemotaxis protein methyltransferase CheR
MIETQTRITIKDLDKVGSRANDIQMNDKEFRLFRDLVYQNSGISLADAKKTMLHSRLQKRLRFHNLSSFSTYYELILSRSYEGDELREMINCVTTNKTDFFRESHHFEFVEETILPEIIAASATAGESRKLRVWHAGCSTGEEPYSLAMVLRDSLKSNIDRWDIRQLASDIDTNVLEHAKAGVYERDRFEQVPLKYRSQSFLTGTGERSAYVKIKSELLDMVTFRQINLLDPVWPIQSEVRFDAVFCRNVVIYFDKPTQRTLFARFHKLLRPGGYLIIGHSESLLGVSTDFESLGHTIYRKSESGDIHSEKV